MPVARGLLAVALTLTLFACVPDVEDASDEDAPAAAEEDVEEPHREAVLDATGAALEPLDAAAAALDDAATSGAASAGALGRAVALLTASTELRGMAGAPEDPGTAPFLPSSEPEDGADVLNRTVAAARGAGDHGSQLTAVLHDPVAGDLTAWQEDPDLALEAVRDAAEDGSEEAIAEIPGAVPRALAWTLAAADTGDADTSRELVERAAAHLAVARAALGRVRDALAEG